MKLIRKNMFRLLMLCMAIVGIGLSSCGDDIQEVTVPSGEGSPEVKLFSPLSGGFGTELSFYGTNLPTDLKKIKVTINGKEAEVKSSNGRILTAIVQKDSGSGAVKVYITNEAGVEEINMTQAFEYGFQRIVSTYVGDGQKADIDGAIEKARMKSPYALLWHNDELYVNEEGANPSTANNYAAVRRISNGQITTLWNDYEDTDKTAHKMRGMAFDKDGNSLYVGNDKDANGTMGLGILSKETDFDKMQAVYSTAGVLTVAVHPVTGDVFVGQYQPCELSKYANGQLTKKLDVLNRNGKGCTLTDMIFNKEGTKLYISVAYYGHSVLVADYNKDTDEFSNLRTLAGPAVVFQDGAAVNKTGYVDGRGKEARFNEPQQLDIDGDGNLYVADCKNHCIRKITPDGTVSTYAGVGTSSGFADGAADNAKFNRPYGCKFGPDGALYVADNYNHRIRKIAEQ